MLDKKEQIAVLDFVSTRKTLSCSALQNHFIKGYNWGGRMIDWLEDNKLIGPFNASKEREVIGSPALFEQEKERIRGQIIPVSSANTNTGILDNLLNNQQ